MLPAFTRFTHGCRALPRTLRLVAHTTTAAVTVTVRFLPGLRFWLRVPFCLLARFVRSRGSHTRTGLVLRLRTVCICARGYALRLPQFCTTHLPAVTAFCLHTLVLYFLVARVTVTVTAVSHYLSRYCTRFFTLVTRLPTTPHLYTLRVAGSPTYVLYRLHRVTHTVDLDTVTRGYGYTFRTFVPVAVPLLHWLHIHTVTHVLRLRLHLPLHYTFAWIAVLVGCHTQLRLVAVTLCGLRFALPRTARGSVTFGYVATVIRLPCACPF